MDIKDGTTVWLKSGSPAMTVKFLNQRGTYTCNWFVGAEIKEHDFSLGQLTDQDPTPGILPIISGG